MAATSLPPPLSGLLNKNFYFFLFELLEKKH